MKIQILILVMVSFTVVCCQDKAEIKNKKQETMKEQNVKPDNPYYSRTDTSKVPPPRS